MGYDRTPLPAEELAMFLRAHPAWRQVGAAIERTYELPSFPKAIEFVTRVAQVAEAHDHHPDIDIRFSKVKLSLTTHDAGGLTFRDPLVAAACDAMHQVT